MYVMTCPKNVGHLARSCHNATPPLVWSAISKPMFPQLQHSLEQPRSCLSDNLLKMIPLYTDFVNGCILRGRKQMANVPTICGQMHRYAPVLLTPRVRGRKVRSNAPHFGPQRKFSEMRRV